MAGGVYAKAGWETEAWVMSSKPVLSSGRQKAFRPAHCILAAAATARFCFGFGMVAWSAVYHLFILFGRPQPDFGVPLLIAPAVNSCGAALMYRSVLGNLRSGIQNPGHE